MTEIGTPPCATCDLARTDCRGWRACEAFATWVDTGDAVGDRTPTLERYAALYPGVVPARVLHRYWRSTAGAISGAAQRGETATMTRAEYRRRYRERLKLIWAVDPAKREAHLARKRAQSMRRERARGRQPLTPERAAARCRLGWERRRTQAPKPMTRDELLAAMARLDLTAESLALQLGMGVHNVRGWMRPDGRRVSDRAAAWLRSQRPGSLPGMPSASASDRMSSAEFRAALAIARLSIAEVAAKAGVTEERVHDWRNRSTKGPPRSVGEWLRALVAIRQEASAAQIVGRPRGINRRRPQHEEAAPIQRGIVVTTPAPEPLRDVIPATHGDVVLVTPPIDPRPPAVA
ncbi:MAG: hypothetical protein WD793_02250 [Steroidobacteraceae bacterium]